jgi:hypothetical protein
MLVVFAFALLILAAAVVVLFAMLAELATRVPERAGAQRDPHVRHLDGARLGTGADTWPAALPTADAAVLLVLSTACSSCDDVARQLTVDPGHTDWTGVGVVISTAERENADAFVERHGLAGTFPVYVDDGGEWVGGQFDVRMSPSALVFRDGRLESAHTFNDVSSLRANLHTPTKEAV